MLSSIASSIGLILYDLLCFSFRYMAINSSGAFIVSEFFRIQKPIGIYHGNRIGPDIIDQPDQLPQFRIGIACDRNKLRKYDIAQFFQIRTESKSLMHNVFFKYDTDPIKKCLIGWPDMLESACSIVNHPKRQCPAFLHTAVDPFRRQRIRHNAPVHVKGPSFIKKADLDKFHFRIY